MQMIYCKNCGQLVDMNAQMCPYCGAMINQYGTTAQQNPYNQQYQGMTNQMLWQQQELMRMNQTLTQQNEALRRKNVDNKKKINLSVRNPISLIAAFVSLLTFVIGNFVSDWGRNYTLWESATYLSRYVEPDYEGWDAVQTWFMCRINLLLILLIILLVVGGFIDIKGYRFVLILLNAVSLLCWVGSGAKIGFAAYYMIFALIFAGISSRYYKAPLHAVSSDTEKTGEWRCKHCDTKNKANAKMCKACGIYRD